MKIQTELKESLARLGDLQVSSEEQRRKLEEELKQALADRDAAASEWTTVLFFVQALTSVLYSIAIQLIIDIYFVSLLISLVLFGFCSGSLEELVSSNDVMLKEKEQQARHLEDKEKQLQEEVRSLV